ncbi:glycosyltransferase [Ramlibacter terrae]|uniref:Glycosyltransferase n=1 Tax=Ramlibacter terrae TaxID=2732511 RepID=A0ABX6P1V5_9BURK|nr:glycosyltransferase [Ramlibacter terrae]
MPLRGTALRVRRDAARPPPGAWPALYRALDKLRPDAIVLHSVKTIVPCALYARRRRIPLLAVEHQNNGLKTRSEWAASRLLMLLADRVVVLTDDYRQQLQARLGAGFRAGKVCVIPNGIDTEAYRPAAAGLRGGPPRTIGMASRFTGIKRHDLLLDALVLLAARDGPGAWRLTPAGDGETLAAVRARAEALGLKQAVDFPGYLDEQALQRWFSSLDDVRPCVRGRNAQHVPVAGHGHGLAHRRLRRARHR